MHILFILSILLKPAVGCYTAIFGFGDSVTDTGNHLLLSPSNDIPHMGLPPYGETFFGHPTGRCSDGRLIIDFIASRGLLLAAERFGLPLLPPSAGALLGGIDTKGGVNFAFVGAAALDSSFYEERGITNIYTNVSMRVQLNWFKDMLPSLCTTRSNCGDLFEGSLFILGPFGGNDYRHALFQGSTIEEVWSFAPKVVDAIASAVKELIEVGAKTIMVPGEMPDGCLAVTLSQFLSTSSKDDYDPETGCLIWMNKLAEFHNQLLITQLHHIQKQHPNVLIIYADYYNAAMKLYRSPRKHGFVGDPKCLNACCGGGGPYNYNSSAECGIPPSTACSDPSTYIDWDGPHLTEAAYRLISIDLLDGPFTSPQLRDVCATAKPKDPQEI
nr:GDSL esterase/lipase At1g28580-like isoform X1 [Ipomoea trifida]